MKTIALGCHLLLIALATTSGAGQYNSTLNIGDAAPAWTDLPGTDGQKHALADLKDAKVVVVVFTCNSCPVAGDYEERIIAAAKKHAGKVEFVAINVNRIAEDSLENMTARAKEKQYPFPYLYDQTQQIAKAYGAAFTPEFFVLSPDRKIVFMGGMDDNSNPAEVKQNYLEPAITAALAGNTPDVKEAVARGCRIRFARERR